MIKKKPLLDDLKGIKEVLVGQGDPILASVLNRAIACVEKQPEVVRCKDCRHYDNSEGICWCKLNSKFYPGGMDWHSFPEDGFCSYGERKNDGR